MDDWQTARTERRRGAGGRNACRGHGAAGRRAGRPQRADRLPARRGARRAFSCRRVLRMSWRHGLAAAVLLLAGGCESIGYYRQAIEGHLGVMASARPIDAWLADPSTSPALRERLETARRIRQYAARELGLPDNGSYLSYADLGRPVVGWDVLSAAEFSVEPKKECFPFAGCVSYRGFFSEEGARRHAPPPRGAGYDAHVAGVAAYSTPRWLR